MSLGPRLHDNEPPALLPFLSGIGGLFTEPGDGPLALAVSGGGDSVALLRLAHHIACRYQTNPITVATVDHGLRPEARAEAEWVGTLCARLGLPHQILTWDGDKTGGNLQDLARRARYRLLADWATGQGAATVALGHTLDDQAETFFLQLSRSAGLAGLSGMTHAFAAHGMTFRRPLLGLRREDLRDYLRGIGQDWKDDPSNEDDRYHRIRLRKARAVFDGLGLTVEAVTASMAHLGQAETALQDCVAEVAARQVTLDRGDLLIPADLPGGEIAHRLWQAAFQWMSGSDYPPRASAMREVLQLAHRAGSATLDGCLLTHSDGVLRLTREAAALRGVTCATTDLWDRRWRLEGPHAPDLHVAALGEAVRACPNWRDSGLPRSSLLASPAVWQGQTLVAAPLAGLQNGWQAQIVADFIAFLHSH